LAITKPMATPVIALKAVGRKNQLECCLCLGRVLVVTVIILISIDKSLRFSATAIENSVIVKINEGDIN
jgi:uncharacterized membrane protein